MIKDYRFKSSFFGKQILEVTEGPREIQPTDLHGANKGDPISITVWRNADRYEAEALLRGDI